MGNRSGCCGKSWKRFLLCLGLHSCRRLQSLNLGDISRNGGEMEYYTSPSRDHSHLIRDNSEVMGICWDRLTALKLLDQVTK